MARATVVALTGDLGAGKTTFIQGFARGLGVRETITSPTFVIFRRHRLPGSPYQNLFHVDAYRIHGASELTPLGLKEILADRSNLVLIEWANHVAKALPRNAIRIRFSYGEKERERTIEVRGYR